MDFFLHFIVSVCITLILVESFNLVFGLTNLFNLAHLCFFAVSSYTTAILFSNFELSFFVILLVSILMSLLFGVFVWFLSLKLDDIFFGIVSLLFFLLVDTVIRSLSFTGGMHGIFGILRDGWFDEYFFWIVLGVTLFSLFVLFVFFNNEFGRNLRAISENNNFAKSLGVNLNLNCLLVLLISAFFVGIAGFLYAFNLSIVDPSSFKMTQVIVLITYVLAGRRGSFWGVLFVTVFLEFLKEILSFFSFGIIYKGFVVELIYLSVLFLFVYLNRSRLKINRRFV